VRQNTAILKISYIEVKETVSFGDLAYYGLACTDIQILISDLDSPQNFIYGGK
jgi:hypothetical protein